MRPTYNEYGQLEEHPDYYVDEPDFVDMADGDMELADCMTDYYDYCEPWRVSGGYFDDSLLGPMSFEDFKNQWFEEREETAHAA